MIFRSIEPVIAGLLAEFPAVAILGPRQVGKTTIAHALADRMAPGAVYLDLEAPSDRAKVADAELYLGQFEDKLVILDEIHRVPELFAILRGLIDRRRRKGKAGGHFLLLGSASMDLLKQTSESLAGRLAYQELAPLSIVEVAGQPDAATTLWVRGGFPASFLAATDAASERWRTAFIKTYLERDVPMLGPRIPAETLARFWQMLAHEQGQLLNGAKLASALGVSGQTVSRYLDIMVDLLLVRRLQPWASNGRKRLVRTPKVYVRDSGLLHTLLGIGTLGELLGHPIAGWSWEGYAIESILNALPEAARAYFYREARGSEIDLVIEFNHKTRWAIEVKRSLADPRPAKGFYEGCDEVEATRRIVVYPGDEAYPIPGDTEVMPLELLLADAAFRRTFQKLR